ncbi:hypothetical protein ACLOJK_006692, partial [Asimina triloba]
MAHSPSAAAFQWAAIITIQRACGPTIIKCSDGQRDGASHGQAHYINGLSSVSNYNSITTAARISFNHGSKLITDSLRKPNLRGNSHRCAPNPTSFGYTIPYA